MKKAASVFLRTEMTLRDVELLSQWMENPIITRYLNEMPGVSDSLRDLAGKIPAPLLALRFNQEGRFFLVCEKDGEAIGFVKLCPLQSAARTRSSMRSARRAFGGAATEKAPCALPYPRPFWTAAPSA